MYFSGSDSYYNIFFHIKIKCIQIKGWILHIFACVVVLLLSESATVRMDFNT